MIVAAVAAAAAAASMQAKENEPHTSEQNVCRISFFIIA